MEDIEYKAIKSLAACTFLPGTFDKRIARQWSEMADRDREKPMTKKGRRFLWVLVWKYRRQIGDDEVLDYAKLVSEHPNAQKALHDDMAKRQTRMAQMTFKEVER
jgi:hypothetical protein